jgi:putative endonuclease
VIFVPDKKSISYSKILLGQQVENLAMERLIQAGWVCLKRNYRIRGGEIDLIFEESFEVGNQELVFVEVRARCGQEQWVSGVESVDWRKQRKLKRTINHFLMHYSGVAQSMRVDILAWDGRDWEHIKNVWFV